MFDSEKEILQSQQEEDSVQKQQISQAFRAVAEEEQADNNRHQQRIHIMEAKYAELLEQVCRCPPPRGRKVAKMKAPQVSHGHFLHPLSYS